MTEAESIAADPKSEAMAELERAILIGEAFDDFPSVEGFVEWTCAIESVRATLAHKDLNDGQD